MFNSGGIDWAILVPGFAGGIVFLKINPGDLAFSLSQYDFTSRLKS